MTGTVARGTREGDLRPPRQEHARCEKTNLARGMTREPAPWSWTGAARCDMNLKREVRFVADEVLRHGMPNAVGSRAGGRRVELKRQSWGGWGVREWQRKGKANIEESSDFARQYDCLGYWKRRPQDSKRRQQGWRRRGKVGGDAGGK
ncbi:hypothetical protein C8R44DRAFT_735930 [Mycena epipterygia]|nr:hypothetical protein C8R44DRAFT_735930 [Mycena epipterygia]